MTSYSKTQMFTAAAAFGTAAMFSMLSFGGNAEAAQSLSRCQGSSAKAVVACCDMLTKAQRPLWMIQSRSSCPQAVVCGGAKNSERRCFVRITYREKDGEDDNDGGGRAPKATPSRPN